MNELLTKLLTEIVFYFFLSMVQIHIIQRSTHRHKALGRKVIVSAMET